MYVLALRDCRNIGCSVCSCFEIVGLEEGGVYVLAFKNCRPIGRSVRSCFLCRWNGYVGKQEFERYILNCSLWIPGPPTP